MIMYHYARTGHEERYQVRERIMEHVGTEETIRKYIQEEKEA